MYTTPKPSKVFYLFVDGMSETAEDLTSLSASHTPNMDSVLSAGQGGFYIPVIAPWHNEPKTDVVIPEFFGLRYQQNPGRPALELIDLGVTLRPGTAACFLTLDSGCYAIDQLENTLLHLLPSLPGLKGAVFRLSIAYNYGIRVVVGNIATEFEDAARLSLSEIGRLEEWRVLDLGSPTTDTIETIEFLGWAKGALRGAFCSLGAVCNPFNRAQGVYSDWKTLEQDFDQYVLGRLAATVDRASIYVLYTKETTFAARRNDRTAKIRAIEAMDGFLGKSIPYLDINDVVVIAADHSCDIGGDSNPAGHTVFAFARVADIRCQAGSNMKFCERTFTSVGTEPVSQHDLIALIESHR